jgi:hypothetical protein
MSIYMAQVSSSSNTELTQFSFVGEGTSHPGGPNTSISQAGLIAWPSRSTHLILPFALTHSLWGYIKHNVYPPSLLATKEFWIKTFTDVSDVDIDMFTCV